jgi:starch synthase
MPPSEDTTDIQLKLALTGADVSTLFQGSPSILRRLRGHQRGDSPDITLSDQNSAASEVLSLSTGNPETGNIVAHYSQQKSSLEVSGYLHPRLPLRFSLRRGSQTYYNFIQYILSELNDLDSLPASVESLGSEAREALSRLRSSLEECLAETRGIQPNSSVDILGSDFETRANRTSLEAVIPASHRVRRSLLPDGYGASNRKEFLVRGRQNSEIQHISGFLTLEINEVVTPKAKESEVPSKASIHWLSAVSAKAVPDGVLLRVQAKFEHSRLDDYDFYFRWGSSSSDAGPWIDEEVSLENRKLNSAGVLSLEAHIQAEKSGNYHVCAYARHRASGEELWISQAGFSDTSFVASSRRSPVLVNAVCQEMIDHLSVKRKIIRSFSSFEQFVRVLSTLDRDPQIRGLGRYLFEVVEDNQSLVDLLNQYYRQALSAVEEHRTNSQKIANRFVGKPDASAVDVSSSKRRVPIARLKRVISILQNIGIGEVVFIAPEGPQAIAGGLAQVVVGLSKSLSRAGTSCTIISTLYEESQGSKHLSASEMLEHGMLLMGERVPLVLAGRVRVNFGETKYSGTDQCRTNPRAVSAKVYLAESQGLRVFLLHHPVLGDKLYSGSSSEEQLRKALFLSRGALEILKADEFSIRPHLLISNDWPSALVPALLKADPSYSESSRFKGVETCHILHNAGPGYQGRFFVNEFGEDIWPLAALDDEHFLGISDSSDKRYLNLTSAAVVHSSRGVVTVSRPYADQLLASGSDENLHRVLSENDASLFGISNGIDLETLREVFWKGGESARSSLGEGVLLRSHKKSSHLLRHIPAYKASLKRVVQREFGLEEGREKILISFVGRLTEQKGIRLLSAPECASGQSVLEDILESHPQVQFLIGGPPSAGDDTCVELRREIERLSLAYPGRIQGFFSFVPHQKAIQITQGSDFFLMPSRYEPGGITQLEALASGTLVFARNSGGLSATLRDYTPERNDGDSFLFEEYSCDALRDCIERGLSIFAQQSLRDALILQAASAQNDWKHRVPKYGALFQHLSGVLRALPDCSFLRGKSDLLSGLTARVSTG